MLKNAFIGVFVFPIAMDAHTFLCVFQSFFWHSLAQ